MRSIWSKNYSPFEKSNPFSASKNSFEQTKALPNTFGMHKTIPNKQVSQHESLKRKIEQIDLEDCSSSSCEATVSSSASSSLYSNSYDSVKSEKKIKLEAGKADIDALLNEYSQSSTSVTLSEAVSIKHEFSSYFSSAKVTSPILNKVCIITSF
jgi:hypothetical protein